MNKMNQEPLSGSPGYPNGSAPQGLAELFGVTAAMQMLRRRFLIMALVGATVAATAFTFLMLQTPSYSATSLLIINPRQETVLNSQAVVGSLPLQSSAIDSEIELLRSPALMSDLAAALGLQAQRAGGEVLSTEDIAGSLSGAIDVNRRGMTYVIEITANSTDPQRAQLIANTYADVYIASQVNQRVDTAQRANSWLARRLAELRDDVQAKESAAETFRVQSGLVSAQGSTLQEQQTINVQSQVLQAQADLAEREARFRQLQELRDSGAPLESIGNALNSETVRGLREREADIARRQSDLENRYLPTHPAVQAIRAERQDIESQIQREIQRITVNLGNEVSVARARLATLQNSMREAAGDLSDNSGASVRLRELEREAAASREVYESYLQRYQEIADQDQLNISDARLLAYASTPTSPSSPKLRISLALAIAIGLLLGIGAGVVAEILDQSVKNADDLESKVGYPAIASIPTISKRMMRQMPPAERHPSGYLVGRPMSAFTEALRVLRTVIVYSKLDFSVKVVAVTSALPDEGKTTISMCLARVAAMSGQRVCVVDCDLRKQSINDVIDIETDVGILQVLAGEAPWRSAIVRDPNSDAHVLPVATSGFTPRDVFGSEAMERLIGELRAHYDLVILDCAPILAVAETRILVKHADTTVLVARAGRSAIGAVRSAVAQTEAAGGKVLGIALNCVLPHWQSYADSLYFYQSKSYYSVS
ncbi:MAG TPA: polysaccharide biosynthesis tyrosine autokinase [Vitreimonas sp.]|uniref:GumC family protein n=1 Tax=Vitreimonas sp. TaxID=3069702 RepID=UPI002D452636|nr:polysaccharide biosynthesis tyrosine autokinase [Vitreimonas sp.]HYD88950.1 polysaccharide biosynthesis tyrosine autokinase [Vitreimonas sp.]